MITLNKTQIVQTSWDTDVLPWEFKFFSEETVCTRGHGNLFIYNKFTTKLTPVWLKTRSVVGLGNREYLKKTSENIRVLRH